MTTPGERLCYAKALIEEVGRENGDRKLNVFYDIGEITFALKTTVVLRF